MVSYLQWDLIGFDLDNTMADFNLSAARTLEEMGKGDAAKILAELDKPGVWINKVFPAMPMAEFWAAVSVTGVNWWRGMPPLSSRFPAHPTMAEAVALAKQHTAYVIICTALPAKLVAWEHAAQGKLLWIHDHLGQKFSDTMLCGASKCLLSRTARLLIDDRPDLCEEWETYGGTALPWKAAEHTLETLAERFTTPREF